MTRRNKSIKIAKKSNHIQYDIALLGHNAKL